MFNATQFNQVFTVFGSYVLEGDYVRATERSGQQARCDARKTEPATDIRTVTRN